MEKRSATERQQSACGYEPRTGAQPWTPVSLNIAWRGSSTTCPGYTTTLPETIEIARARSHWKDGGGLRDFCDEPNELLRLGVEIAEGASAEMQRWAIENPVKK